MKVPVLTFGCGTFGAKGSDDPLFASVRGTDVQEARRLVDVCLEAGLTMFDTSDFYSAGQSEAVLGQAVKGRRDEVLIATKTCMPVGERPDDSGTSRSHLIRACDAALARLDTDYIDLFQMHYVDSGTPIEETVATLDDLVRAGKIRYVGVSNFTSWRLMKSLAIADRRGYSRYVSHEVFYALTSRDYEWELMPLAQEEGVGALVYSPLAWGRLTGKFRRGEAPPKNSRAETADMFGPPVDAEHLYDVIDVLDEMALETGKSIPQVAINWLVQRPTVSSVIIGARTEEQLRENIAAVGWSLTSDQIARLDAATEMTAPYPYFLRSIHPFGPLDPPPVESARRRVIA